MITPVDIQNKEFPKYRNILFLPPNRGNANGVSHMQRRTDVGIGIEIIEKRSDRISTIIIFLFTYITSEIIISIIQNVFIKFNII